MEMIKWGYVPKDSKTFECKNCGSIFKADSDEYKTLSQYAYIHDGIQYVCYCPLCGKKVYI